MTFLFEDDLVEGAVFLCASGKRPGIPLLQIRRFHAERERCYAIPDPDDRAAAFARVQLVWFQEWRLEGALRATVSRFPALKSGLAALAFRQARGRNDEGAELYRNPDGAQQGIVALNPNRFASDSDLTRFLHHELAHLADMVDENFGYSPVLDGTAQTASQQRLVRDRYRLLWNVSVDGRLTRRGLGTVADETRRRGEFNRGFAFLEDARRQAVFDNLWGGHTAGHEDLLAIASDPRGLHEQYAPVPGAPCPICGFAAFQWVEVTTLQSAARKRIHADFPNWHGEGSLCARCAEIYESTSNLRYPATACL
ncbi:MAG: hypothetical protein H7A46_12270 [Verrucomicrobiales bacterium]|nr:hypothetical protein [Verrucomicrobiales bacterium]